MSGQIQQSPQDRHYSPHVSSSLKSNDEIDLIELFKALWNGKFIIATTTFLFTVGATLFALNQPNIYQSRASFVVENVFYGSRLVSEPKVSPQYLASSELKKIISSLAHRDASVLKGISISYNERSKVISISKTSTDSQAAFDGVLTFSLELNRALKLRELEKVQTSIEALKLRDNVSSLKTKEYLDELLALQLFKEALLESPDSKLVTQISEVVKPKSHIKPKRTIIAGLGFLFGVLLGVSIVLARIAFRREQD